MAAWSTGLVIHDLGAATFQPSSSQPGNEEVIQPSPPHPFSASGQPSRWCPGCQETHAPGGCPKAKKFVRRESDQRRGTAASRGYGAKWQKLSRAYLDAHTECRICKAAGLVVVSEVVDHIVPHRGDMGLFWQRMNWQPLCKTCHDRKTAAGQ